MAAASPAPASNDLVKSATAFSLWGSNGWAGSLAAWEGTQTHLLKMTSPATFTVRGTPITSVQVNVGWNWIAFASPTDSNSLAAVSHSAGFEPNDLLKSSTAFSVWGQGTGFAGSLNDLQIGNGYLLKCTRAGTITFSSSVSATSVGRRRASTTAAARGDATSSLAPPNGASTAALVVTLEIEGAARTSGRLSAFSSSGVLLGVQTAHLNGHFYLSVTSPHEAALAAKGIDSPSLVHFIHTDDDGLMRKLDKSYRYEANALMHLQLRDAPPAARSAPLKPTSTSNKSAPAGDGHAHGLEGSAAASGATRSMSYVGVALAVVGVALVVALIAIAKTSIGKRPTAVIKQPAGSVA